MSDKEALDTLQQFIKTDAYNSAIDLPIDEADLIKSKQAKQEWDKKNKFLGLGVFFVTFIILEVLLGVAYSITTPKNFFHLIPFSVYVIAFTLFYFILLVAFFYTIVFSLRARSALRNKRIKQHFAAENLIYLDQLDLLSVEALNKVKQAITDSHQADVDALIFLSETLLEGKYLESNSKVAVVLAAFSAELGNSKAAYKVAELFRKGHKTLAKNSNQYVAWLSKAAELGSYAASMEFKKLPSSLKSSNQKASAKEVIQSTLGLNL